MIDVAGGAGISDAAARTVAGGANLLPRQNDVSGNLALVGLMTL